MRHRRIVLFAALLIGLAFAALLLGGWSALAQEDAAYHLTWWSVDGGGGDIDGGGYTLSVTIGQPDAATWQGAGYALAGGFWGRGEEPRYTVYLPLLLR